MIIFRKTENLNGLPKKQLFKHGYGRLDSILKEVKIHHHSSSNNGKPKILIAPSWGKHGLLETKGEELVEILLNAEFNVVVRPHPETTKHSPKVINSIQKRFSNHPNFVFEGTITSLKSLLQSDLMISDWSGAALDYAFGLNKPVLFIDVPRKVNNLDYDKIGIEPLEVSIRSRIGAILALDELDNMATSINTLLKNYNNQKQVQLRDETVFNLGAADSIGAQELQKLINEII